MLANIFFLIAVMATILLYFSRMPTYRMLHRAGQSISKDMYVKDELKCGVIFTLYLIALEVMELFRIFRWSIFLQSSLSVLPLVYVYALFLMYKDYEETLERQRYFRKSTKARLEDSDAKKETMVFFIVMVLSIVLYVFA